MSDHILALSTEVEPPQKFTVDGVEYDLLGLQHLSPEAESKAIASFSRLTQQAQRLDRADSDTSARRISEDLRKRRIDLIVQLTTLEHDVASRLPLAAQTALFKAIQREMGQDDEDGEG